MNQNTLLWATAILNWIALGGCVYCVITGNRWSRLVITAAGFAVFGRLLWRFNELNEDLSYFILSLLAAIFTFGLLWKLSGTGTQTEPDSDGNAENPPGVEREP